MSLTKESYFLIIATTTLTYFFIRRKKLSGIFTYLYIGLINFCLLLFSIFIWKAVSSSVTDIYQAFNGEKYRGVITSSYQIPKDYVHSQEYQDLTSSNKKISVQLVSSISYGDGSQTLVRFITKEGDVLTRTLDFTSDSYRNGDTINVLYNSANDKLIYLGFPFVIKNVGIFLFFCVFTFALTGITSYALGLEMDWFFTILSSFGFYIFIPFIMIGFDALLIYAVFYGNEVPWFAYLLLGFFIFILTLSIFGYFKMIFSKGKPKMRRVSSTQWEGDWEDEEEYEYNE